MPLVDPATGEAYVQNYEVIERLQAENERLRAALEFVRTDPCFKLLGTVTHDTVTDALGLTNILDR